MSNSDRESEKPLDNQLSAINVENNASAGNRTRASRVAGENSTTEPPMLMVLVWGEVLSQLRLSQFRGIRRLNSTI